jgi:hypothetical protein
MVFASWRGVVGVVKPTHRPGSLEEFIRLLPEGIGVVPVYLNFKRGTEDEFRAALKAVEEKVAELAEEGLDLIHPEGAPPFMVHGYKGEEKIIKEWESKYKTPMVRLRPCRPAPGAGAACRDRCVRWDLVDPQTGGSYQTPCSLRVRAPRPGVRSVCLRASSLWTGHG